MFSRLLVFLVVVFAAGALAWMMFLPVVLTTRLRQRTGFDATVQSVVANPFTGTVELRGFVLTNPPTFPVRDFLEVRQFSADAEILTLFTDRPVFTSMTIDLAKVTLVKRDANHTNAASFEHNLTAPGDPTLPVPSRTAKGFLIRRLVVRIDEVVINDYSGREPTRQDFKLGINQTFTDVTGVRQLMIPAVLEGLLPVGAAINGLLPGALGQAVTEVVKEVSKSGAGLINDASRKTGEKIKGYFDALEESKKP